MPTATNQQPYIFVLSFSAPSPGEGKPGIGSIILGTYSTLDNAQTEAKRHHKKAPLEWKQGTTDDPRCHYWYAVCTLWHEYTHLQVWRYRLDSKAFRI